MNDIRTQIQTALSTLTSIDSGPAKPDGLVEKGQTYFGYEVQETYQGSDQDKNYTMEISVTGRLVRRVSPTEGTLSILDSALEDIKTKFKGMNFKYSYNDITIDDNIRKILFTATAIYTELNDELII